MIRGRKRKPGARHPCGKRIRGETEREVMQTALEARQRHYRVGASRARDERLGTSLGRLSFQELISPRQYDAGLRFAELYRRHHMTLGLPMPHPQSPAGLMLVGGSFGGSLSELRYYRFRIAPAVNHCGRFALGGAKPNAFAQLLPAPGGGKPKNPQRYSCRRHLGVRSFPSWRLW